MRRRDSWDDLLDERRSAVQSFFEDVGGDPANDLDRTLDSAILEASQRMDPGAGHSPWLDVHVSGPNVGFGALNVRIMDQLLPPIQLEIDTALPNAARESTGLELVGVGAGSAILHLRPTVPAIESDGSLPAISSVIDSAVRRVLDLHDAVERRDSPGQIAATNLPELFPRLQRLIGVLESNDLMLELVWRSPTAARRRSIITRQGRAYASRMFERQLDQATISVAGYVYEQSLKGNLKLKADPTKKSSHTYEISVSPEVLREAGLYLGQYLRALVVRRRQRDQLGQQTDDSYELLRIIEHGESLDSM